MRQFVTIGIVLAGMLLVAGCGARKSEQYRQDGDTLFNLGRVADATGAYRRAEELNPQNIAAKLGLGRCLLIDKKTDDALACFREALAIDPSSESANFETIRILLNLNKADEAVKIAQQYATAKPEQGGVLHAYVLRETGKDAEALAILEKLKADFPNSAIVCVDLAASYLKHQEPAKAETVLREVIEKIDKTSVAARLLIVDCYKAQGKTDQLITELDAQIKAKPEDPATSTMMVLALLAANRLEDAGNAARVLQQQQPNSGWANLASGSCLLARGSNDEALTLLKRAAATLPQYAQVLRNLPNIHPANSAATPASGPAASPAGQSAVGPDLAKADWHTLWAQASLGTLVARRAEFMTNPESNLVETLSLAALFIGNKEVVEELSPKLPSGSPLTAFFEAIRQGKIAALDQAMTNWQETDPERKIMRSNAHAMGMAIMGAKFQAISALSESLKTDAKHAVTYYNLAQIFRSSGNSAIAARVYSRLVSVAPANMEAHQLLFNTCREANLPDEARKSAEATFSLYPDRVESSLNLAQAYLDRKEYPMAEEILRRATQNQPAIAALQIALGRVLIQSGKLDEAHKVLDAIPDESTKSDELRYAKAFAAAASSEWDNVLVLTNLAPDAKPIPSIRFLRIAALLTKGTNTEAADLLRRAREEKTFGFYDSVLLTALGDTTTPPSQDITDFAARLSKKPDTLSQFAVAVSFVRAPFYRVAMERLQTLYDNLGGDPDVATMLMQCYAQIVPEGERLEKARGFTEKFPDALSVWLSYANLATSVKDIKTQQEALEKAVQKAPQNLDALRAQAGFFERQKDQTTAMQIYERILAIAPDDPMANNNYAYALLMTNGNLDTALAAAERALAKRPQDPYVLHTLGVIQLKRGKLEESEKALQQAISLRPAEPTVLLDYGQELIAKGQKEEGRRYVTLAKQYADQLGLDFPRRAEADAILATP